jgi:predicted transposase/invertase (TIGR01784 family)
VNRPGHLHDRFFREIASAPEVAAGLLENFLPADVRALVDFGAIEIQKDSFIEPDLRAYYSDALFRVRLAEALGYVYFLVEHKSHPERFVHVQVLNYVKSIWGKRKGPDLPTVIPVVLYHGQRSWPYDSKFSNVFRPKAPALRRFFPDFEIVLADLSRYSEKDVQGAVLTRAFLLVLKHIQGPDFPERLPGIFRLLGELAHSRTGLGHLEAMLRYMARAADNIAPETLERLVEEHFPDPEGERLMATLAEQWEQRGEEKGIRKGKLEGIQEAIQEGLQLKFGDAGLDLMKQIKEIQDLERLRGLLKLTWTASRLEEFHHQIS